MMETVTFYEIYCVNAGDLPAWEKSRSFPSAEQAAKWVKDFGEDFDFYQIVKVTREPVSLFDKREEQ